MSTETANPLTVLQTLVGELDSLMDDSAGVAGLHKNGDIATWDELMSDGRYPWLGSLDEARAVCVRPTPAPATSGADVTVAVEFWQDQTRALQDFLKKLYDAPTMEAGYAILADWGSQFWYDKPAAVKAARAVSPAPALSGWRLVPEKPTPEMLKAVWDCDHPGNWVFVPEDWWAEMLAAAPKAPGAAQQPQPADALSDALSGEVAWKALAAILNATGTEDGEGEYRADDREGCLDFVEHTARAALRSRQSVQGEGRNNG